MTENTQRSIDQWLVGTWNPYTWPSPWPYTVTRSGVFTETYRAVRCG